jgi:prophage maintenance system killer protein
MNQAIAAFGIGTFAIGATGGTAMYLGGAAFGSGVTTLGLAGGEASSSFVGVAAEEIIALNQSLGGTTTLTGEADTVVANMSYRVGFTDKAATVIRDIAGRHLFNDANKRTAQAVVELLAKRNGQSVNPAAVRAVIDKVATGAIRTVEEISAALKGGG